MAYRLRGKQIGKSFPFTLFFIGALELIRRQYWKVMENTNQMLKNRTTCVYGFEKGPTFMQKLVLVLLLLMCFMISQPMEVEFVYHMS